MQTSIKTTQEDEKINESLMIEYLMEQSFFKKLIKTYKTEDKIQKSILENFFDVFYFNEIKMKKIAILIVSLICFFILIFNFLNNHLDSLFITIIFSLLSIYIFFMFMFLISFIGKTIFPASLKYIMNTIRKSKLKRKYSNDELHLIYTAMRKYYEPLISNKTRHKSFDIDNNAFHRSIIQNGNTHLSIFLSFFHSVSEYQNTLEEKAKEQTIEEKILERDNNKNKKTLLLSILNKT